MGSRHMIYWRVYVYAHNLYSICGGNSIRFRDCTPSTLRRQPGELHRLLDFANRDLSVLIRHSEMELMNVFEVVQDLLLEVKLNSAEFKDALTPYLATATHQFVHELINFACSPYDDLISYDCNVKYRAMELRAEELAAGEDTGFVLLPGLHSFAKFSCLVDNDECVGFGMDLDTEDEDPKMMDELWTELNTPVLNELRRVLSDRFAQRHSRVQSQIQGLTASQVATAATAATTATTATTATLSPNDIGLELARNGGDSTTARHEQLVAITRNVTRNMTQRAAAAVARNAEAARMAQNYAAGLGADIIFPRRPRSAGVAPKR
ncbi:uncharacterized protein LOC117784675 [Drosophila innubila]|uniref:uncharacterized protein LOC117784675 n=1 Tax=Drosophila innubila TaxID=198719 RepID=UPI00148DB369|nr:uncharacterized protein LOC117784675 [Drosophila innubila]